MIIRDSHATDDQIHHEKRSFIDSLDLDAICALASSHNDGKSCRVVNKDRGSFNACFFVEFDHDGSMWTIRVPIEVSLENTWEKLLNEVATIQ